MSQQSNHSIGRSNNSHSRTLFNSVHFPNGTAVQTQSSLARLSAPVKGCLMDQHVLDLYIPLPCPLCVSLNPTFDTASSEGGLQVDCQGRSSANSTICVPASFVVILGVKNVCCVSFGMNARSSVSCM